MKKSIRTLIIALLVLAILGGGYYFAVKWQPNEKKEEESPVESPQSEYAVNIPEEDVKAVEFHNGYSVFTINNGEKASIEGYSSLVISESKLKSAIGAACSVYATHKIEKAAEKLAEYGVTNKEKFFTVYLNDGSARTFIVGYQTNIDNEYYMAEENSDTVYTVDSYKVDMLMQNPDDFRELSVCTIDNTAFKSLSISRGGNQIFSVKLQEKEEDKKDGIASAMNSYIMTYPYEMPASADRMNDILENLGSVTADSIACENPASLSEYGLDLSSEITVTDGSGTNTLRLGKRTDDGAVYLMCNDLPVVYIAQCPFYDNVVNANADDYIDKFIHIFNINEVTGITTDILGEKHSFKISGDVDAGKAKFKIDGKETEEKAFKTVYQSVIGITLSKTGEMNTSEKQAEITFKFKDKSSKTYTYYKYDERYSVVKSDRGLDSLTLTKNLEAVNDSIKKAG